MIDACKKRESKPSQLGTKLRLAASAAAIAILISGCNSLSRLAEVGEEPAMNPVTNPKHVHNYQPVSMPMPKTVNASYLPNSLWRPGSRAFLKDLRASDIGDIVTVTINVSDSADLSNSSTRTRTTAESVGAPNLLGYEGSLNAILPEAVDPTNLLGVNGSTNNVGSGVIGRTETIDLTVAAVVTQVLSNGNLVIVGTQETRVNYELRTLQITGVIRPQDIDSDNTVNYEQIAEARLAYGGRGLVSDVQQPRWGTQVLDVLMPF